MERVMALPDTHWPWAHKDAVAWVYSRVEIFKPTVIIQLGDLYDQFSQSRFARTHNLMTPSMEMIEARQGAEAMWKNLHKKAPKATLLQILGNHDDRAEKRILEKAPELAHLIEEQLNGLYSFPKVQTNMDTAKEIEIDGVFYIHGHLTGSQNGAHARYFDRPVVHGHTHQGSLWMSTMHNKLIWELDCGFLADQTAVPMKYGATRRNKWVLGYGEITSEGPAFKPYPGKKS